MIPAEPFVIGAIVCAILLAAVLLTPCLRAFRRIGWAVFAVGMILYGGGKSRFTFTDGIRSASPTYSTNDQVVITWQRDTSGGIFVPLTAAVYIDYRPNTVTNAEWGLLAQATVGDWSWTGTLPDATNYDFNVWAYYIPPEPVHTNGVWEYRTLRDSRGENILPMKALIKADGVTISPPWEKQNEENN